MKPFPEEVNPAAVSQNQEVADWLYYLIKEREDSNRLFQTFPSG
jgi:hypothetical protein